MAWNEDLRDGPVGGPTGRRHPVGVPGARDGAPVVEILPGP